VFLPLSSTYDPYCFLASVAVKDRRMGENRQTLAVLLTTLCAGALLFVVLFPYTPTPIATTIGKILVTAVLVFASVTTSLALVITHKLFAFYQPAAPTPVNNELLDLICTRLR